MNLGLEHTPMGLNRHYRPTCVSPALDPGVHLSSAKKMDCRVKPGNDD
jgi:hypothetical protein